MPKNPEKTPETETPCAKRNMVPLSPGQRYSVNQDAAVQILAWAGNLTSSGLQFQGTMFES